MNIFEIQEKSLQEIFDFVGQHLLTQGKKAWIENYDEDDEADYVCCMRTEEGLTCAVGCLCPPDLPRLNEYNSAAGILKGYLGLPSLEQALSEEQIPQLVFLAHLQAIHDFYEVETWESHLRQLAQEYNLTYSLTRVETSL